MNPKPILFVDFDGTICFDKYWRSLPLEKYDQIQNFIFGEDKTILNSWMKGEYTAEEINKIVADKIDIPYEELWGLFMLDCNTMQVPPEILEKLNSLRKKYVVILITGNMDSFTRFTVPSLHLDTFFDHINNSFFHKSFKDDNGGKIFVEYADALVVPIGNCILMDNSVKTCEIFTVLGGKACLITPEQDIMSYLDDLA